MKPISLLRGFFTVGFWTMVSRVLGLAREIIIMALIGPGAVMDAFVAAFRLPNMFRRFFAEGAFNAAFVPMFSKRYEAGQNPEGFAAEAASGLTFVLLILTALALIFMPALVYATAHGFAGDTRFDLTVAYGRVMFPYILLISLSALFSGILNASGHFAAAAAAPTLLNILVIAAMAAARIMGGEAILWLIWAVPLAGVAQLALVWIATERAGIRIRPGRPRWSPEMRSLVAVAIPAALSGGVMQINLLVGQQVASGFDKAVSWLYVADRLYQLPLGVVGIAIGIVLLPDLSRRLAARDEDGARHAFSRACEVALALTLPAAVALAVIPAPLAAALYERGATGSTDTAAIALATLVYGLGLPAFMLQKLLQPLYYAREDTRTPLNYALISMGVNAAIAIGLAPLIGWIACAWATTIAGWVMVALLALGAHRMGAAARPDARFWQKLPRITAAALAMGALLWALRLALADWLAQPGLRYAAVAILVAGGMIGYFAIARAIGALSMRDIKGAMRRG